MTLKYISMFSGIESASVAWHPLGWTPVCFAEPAGAPSRVLAHRWPDVPNVGDMTAHDWSQYRGTVDVVVGGPPCQAFSIAWLRRGLDDDRGNLSLSFAKAIHAIGPDWAVIENVPGWLSMPDNAFGCMLAALVGGNDPVRSPLERGRWPDAGMVAGPRARVAWRVLDAQHFGLAQRRARVFVVAGFGTWTDPAAVLFEPKGVSRDSAPRREARENLAPTLAARTNGGGGLGTDAELDGALIADTLTVGANQTSGFIGEAVAAFGGNNTSGPIDVATAVRAKGGTGHGDFESETFVAHATPALTSNHKGDHDGREGLLVAHALRGEGFDASEDGTGRGTPLVPVAYRTSGNSGAFETGDVTGALDTNTDPAARVVAFQTRGSNVSIGDVTGTLGINSGSASGCAPMAQQAAQVRRLTPTECERLQGFPDGYTRVPVRRYKATPRTKHFARYPDLYDCQPDGTWLRFLDDGPRYKCLGNSKAVPCVRWIGTRIAAVTRAAQGGAS